MKLNGNLVLNSQGNSEIRNVIVERLPKASEPAVSMSEKGRIYFDTTNNVYLYNNGTSWTQLATGGNATALQQEVDAMQAALGAFVGTDGVFNEAALNALDNVSGLTGGSSLLDALAQLDAALTAAAGVDTLGELTDVTVTSPTAGQVLRFTGVGDTSVNATLMASDLGDVQITSATNKDILYHNGTRFINGKPGVASGVQAHDDTLDDLALLGDVAANQIIVGTAPGVFQYQSGATARTSLGAQTQGAVLDQLNVLGAPTVGDQILVSTGPGAFQYESGAVARESLGLVIGTNVQAFDQTLQNLSALGEVSNNQFIVGNGPGSYEFAEPSEVRATLGLVAGGNGDIWVKRTGDTMSGNLDMGGFLVKSIADPIAGDDAATKNYVDSVASGLDLKASVRLATAAPLPAYTAAGAGVGKTITGDANGVLIVDGSAVTVGDRILVKSEGVSHPDHGIYDVVTAGSVSTAFELVRSNDADGSPTHEVTSGLFCFIESGATYANQGFVLVTNNPITVDTTALQFSQFTGAGMLTAGVGLSQLGNTISVNLGAGIAELPNDEVGIELFDPASGALALTLTGTDRTTHTDARLHLILNGTSLAQSAAGLRVASGGISAVHLNAAVAGDGIAGGAGDALSVDVQAGSGLALAAGKLTLTSVPNNALANSTVSLAGDTGSEVVALGQTFTVAGGVGITTSSSATRTLTVDLDASVGDLNDVTLTGLTSTQLLQFNGTNFVNVAPSAVAENISIQDLSDVDADLTAAPNGSVLMVNGNTGQIEAKPMYFLYSSGAPSTSHVVTHNLGRQYANVTIVDSDDEVIIPQSITFNSANQLTVTFNTSINCKVVVMAVPVLTAQV